MNMKLKRSYIVLLCAFLMLIAAACGKQAPESREPIQNSSDHQGDAASPLNPEQTPDPEPEEPEPAPYSVEAKLVAVGDIMMHSPQIPAAYDASTGTYSFDTYFAALKLLLAGDWVIANLETPIAGEELRGFTGYPEFNAPEALADALVDAGFNIVSTANNHSLDRREQGVLNTLANLKASGLEAVGTADSAEAAERILIMEKNEIRMAFLAYTYGTNGIPIPEGKDYLVNLIDEEKIKSDIAKARQHGADVVTVSMHFGYEYHRQPNDEQKTLSRNLIEAGADIILGSHPHVVQPYEFIEVTGTDGIPRKGVVFYSLGNFISNQGPDQGTAKYTDVGVIFSVDVIKHFPEGTIELGEVHTVPTWVNKYHENGKRQYRILPIEDVLAARNDPILTDQQYELLDGYYKEMTSHIESMATPVSAP